MLWITCILTLLFAPGIIWLLRTVSWLYKVHITIRNACVPFLVVKPHWLFGHIFIHSSMTHEGLRRNTEWTRMSKNGVYAYFLPFGQVLVLSHPDVIKKIMRTAEPKGFIPATGSSYKLLIPWLGQGLLTSSGKKWAR